MIAINFPSQDMEEIKRDRYAHPHPRVRQRLEVLWLTSQGLSYSEIGRLGHVSKATVLRYLKGYREGGLNWIREVRFYQPTSELDHYALDIKIHFQTHPPATVKEAMGAIEMLTGLTRSEVAVGQFLKNWGCVPGRSGGFRARRIRPSRPTL